MPCHNFTQAHTGSKETETGELDWSSILKKIIFCDANTIWLEIYR